MIIPCNDELCFRQVFVILIFICFTYWLEVLTFLANCNVRILYILKVELSFVILEQLDSGWSYWSFPFDIYTKPTGSVESVETAALSNWWNSNSECWLMFHISFEIAEIYVFLWYKLLFEYDPQGYQFDEKILKNLQPKICCQS